MLSLDTVAHFSTSSGIGRRIYGTTLGTLLILRSEVINLCSEGEVQPCRSRVITTAKEGTSPEDHRGSRTTLIRVDIAPLSIAREEPKTQGVAEVDRAVS